MMIKKALTSSGKKLIKALKNMSKARLAKKLEQFEQKQLRVEKLRLERQLEQDQLYLQSSLYEAWYAPAIQRSQCSLDARSLDTFVTYVTAEGYCCPEDCQYCCCCCQCSENFENERNENLENEMLH